MLTCQPERLWWLLRAVPAKNNSWVWRTLPSLGSQIRVYLLFPLLMLVEAGIKIYEGVCSERKGRLKDGQASRQRNCRILISQAKINWALVWGEPCFGEQSLVPGCGKRSWPCKPSSTQGSFSLLRSWVVSLGPPIGTSPQEKRLPPLCLSCGAQGSFSLPKFMSGWAPRWRNPAPRWRAPAPSSPTWAGRPGEPTCPVKCSACPSVYWWQVPAFPSLTISDRSVFVRLFAYVKGLRSSRLYS